MSDEPEVQEAVEAPLPEPIAEKPTSQLFRYSAYVHLGPGAAECEGATDGRCREETHFHAWVRMPNQFQQESIVAKARAARARVQRALRDPASDAFVVLEADLEELSRATERAEIIESLVSVNDLTDRLSAMQEIEAAEEWATRTEDVYRRRELEALSDDERDQDELDELVRNNERYVELVEGRITEMRAPRVSALEGLDTEALLGQLREQRVTAESNGAFGSAYGRYSWFLCTLRPCLTGRPQERVFKDIGALDGSAPEIIEALRATFHELEVEQQRGGSGNW